ncbi:MAG: DNA repair protein RecO [Prevotella sp.]|nr:DNA repair protein RecO [Prevotella sp.]
MLTVTQAIVLAKVKYGERKLIVSAYTKEYGMMSFAVNNSARSASTHAGGAAQLMNIVEVEFNLQGNKQIQQIRNVHVVTPLHNIRHDPAKIAQTLFIADFTLHAIRHEQTGSGLFDYITQTVRQLDNSPVPLPDLHIRYVVNILRYIGILPNTDNYTAGATFDIDNSSFLTSFSPCQPHTADADTARLLMLFCNLPPYTNDCGNIATTRTGRNLLTRLLLDYSMAHIPNFPRLQSFDILCQLFD